MRWFRIVFFVSSVLAQEIVYLDNLPAEHPAIQYEKTASNDAVSRLSDDWNSGRRIPSWQENGFGYLPGLLKELSIPVDSQALVFSKTSLQAANISPWNPRAIYFSDEVSVGWIPGAARIEMIALDPSLGPVFYTLDAHQQEQPRLRRQQNCLSCHQGPATLGVPGIFVGSVFPNALGNPSRLGSIITDHRTPFADRWGGWYVHAKKGQQSDRSNAFALDPSDPDALNQPANGLGTINQQQLPRKIDAGKYLKPTSDIVALMTYEHQTLATNLLTRLQWEARLGKNTEARIQEIVNVLLFAGEAPLIEPIQGVSSFSDTFPQNGPRDSKGRSLRDFNLRTRLFQYPLSYLIYSPQFNALPLQVKSDVSARILKVLQAKEDLPAYPSLTQDVRITILEILKETKSDFFRSF